ncbi:hypothetical protein KKD70_02860 [Patescibacteria group bacterium]|nr:hypothetical protein [Patescibacteria group bacterium]
MKILKKIWSGFKKGWMKFAHVLGKINTTILLSIVYFLIVGVYAIVTRIFKLITLPFKKNKETYWIIRKDKFDIESLKHPF